MHSDTRAECRVDQCDYMVCLASRLSIPTHCVYRYSCSSAVCGDHLLLVGGVDWNASNPDIIAISLATQQWSMLHLTLVG